MPPPITRRLAATGALALPWLATGLRPAAAQGGASLSADLAAEIALEAHTYLYPLVTMEVSRRIATNVARAGEQFGRGPMGAFMHARSFPPANFRDVVRPNFDTLYSIAWLDLRAEPMVLTLPDTSGPNGRFYLMPMLDMWTNVFASPGTRTTGTAGGRFALTAPGWSGRLPEGVQVIRAPTPFIWIVGRTQTNGEADYPIVHAQQDAYQVTPLSRLGQAPQPVTGPVDASVDMRTPPMLQVNNMPPAAYFALGMELMRLHPPGAHDQPMLARMARIGMVAGQPFDLARQPAALRAAIEAGAAQSVPHLSRSLPSLGPVRNGWRYLATGMGVYGTDILRRAAVAMVGLDANLPEDAIYPMTATSGDGRPLDGRNRHLLRFPRGQEPPVSAFWSLTLYDGEGFQVANPLNRFAIGDRDPLVRAADGAIDLVIQNEDPGAAQRANWLPAPAGPFNLILRLYGPRGPALDGRWTLPGVRLVSSPADGAGALRLP